MFLRLQVFCFFLCFLSLSNSYAQKQWEVHCNTPYAQHFEEAYQLYPNIPKGILESIAYTRTHIRHIEPDKEAASCLGLPNFYGVMGLVLDGKNYFRSNLTKIANSSSYSIEQIKSDARINILAHAQAYTQLLQKLNIQSTSPLDHQLVIDQLSELPNDGVVQNNFAFDTYLYSVFTNLNSEEFQQTHQLPVYKLDLEKFFGPAKYQLLSSSALILDANQIKNSVGQLYPNQGYRFPCNDISTSFAYPVLTSPADPSNYSSRSGTAITHVTVHTMQGYYSSSISWFQNPSANVSAHYNMRASDGQITQMVCEVDKAWHVSNSNPYAVGIEHEGFVDDATWYTDITYVVSAALSKDIASRNSIDIIRTYDVNGDNGLNPLSDNCYKIKGHQHFPSQTHTDPGPNWDWNRYYDLINPSSVSTTQDLTSCSATFTDPGGSSNYGNNERYFYHIHPTGASSVSLNFSAFDLESNYDYLYIYDGNSTNHPLLAVLSGSTIPSTITANSGEMLLEFRTDCATTRAGWTASYSCNTSTAACAMPTGLTTSSPSSNGISLRWNAVTGATSYEIEVRRSLASSPTVYTSTSNLLPISGLATGGLYFWSVRTVCGNGNKSAWNASQFVQTSTLSSETSTACSGTFTDIGGVIGNYGNNENYTFTIEPTNANSVQLTFNSFELENNYDFMYIYDGNSTSAPLIGTYTNTNSPGTVTSTGGALCIRFTSDNRTTKAGWDADWTCTTGGGGGTTPTLPTHPNPILLDNDFTGNLDCNLSHHDFYDSGGAGGAYGNNESNTKTFCNPDTTKAIRLSFRPNPTADEQLNISTTTSGNDYLSFYNGSSSNSNLIGMYTGAATTSPQPGTFITSGHCLTVQMESDAAFIGSGWIARLYCANPPQNRGTINVGGTSGNKTFTDIGGSVANYGNNESYIVSYCPDASAAAGEVVWADFPNKVGIEKNWDYLYVFDGPDTENSRLIGIYTGDANNQNTLETIKASVDNASGCLTFQFYSDGATSASGWIANMTTGPARLSFGGENCSDATIITEAGEDYAGSSYLAQGTPSILDPSLNISIASLPECSGTNTITRLENTTWYKFTTPDTTCTAKTMQLHINNISCQSEAASGAGMQLILYEANSCFSGNAWPAPVYCADKLTSGDSVDVMNILQPNQSYYLLLDGFSAQHCNFDIQLEIESSGPNKCLLLSQWTGFWGQAAQDHNYLYWEVNNLEDTEYFILERSENSIDFEDLGIIQSDQNSSSYSFKDYEFNNNATSYYRLKSVNTAAEVTYSKVIAINRKKQLNLSELEVYPNPANNALNFKLNLTQAADFELEIFDILGKKLFSFDGEAPKGTVNERINIEQLPQGIYLYKMTINQESITGKFEKI